MQRIVFLWRGAAYGGNAKLELCRSYCRALRDGGKVKSHHAIAVVGGLHVGGGSEI